ncbi:radical SAM protein [Candidatus Accumulibacter sp. ACC003]|uniref:radical SAM protein n=1 Tax=Candidatus Accumulibacter sp. ACC003 TaxID=2823334 RepID=UPI0025BBA785|nr:radical SAM protein [Candidatus Accumulibacter sp. ACC003]
MTMRSASLNFYFKHIKPHAKSPAVSSTIGLLKWVDRECLSLKYSLAQSFPALVAPALSNVNIALISNCSLRCKACLYGRSFLPGHRINVETVMATLDDLAELRIPKVHLYGGEPLLYPEITRLISYARDRGIFPSLGTNAILLDDDAADELYRSGLRAINVGVYGVGSDYDDYVGKAGSFAKLERNLTSLRSRYPDVSLTFAWLIMKPTCSLDAVAKIWDFSKKLDVSFGPILIQYDFPYFSEGDHGELQLLEEDRSTLEAMSRRLIQLKNLEPERISISLEGLAAIPDWIIKKGANDIPCYMEDNVWILPNGDVHVCPKHPAIGNINQTRFKSVVHTKAHEREVRDCLALNCPNCHVRYDTRTTLHSRSRRHYAELARSLDVPELKKN